MSAPNAPPGRTAVVVREGPSKKRPIIVDSIVGVLGAILLILSIVLVNALPEEDVRDPQYKVSFNNDLGPAQVFSSPDPAFMTAGDVLSFEFDVVDHSVHRVVVGLTLREDYPATLPDEFSLEIEAPNGTVYVYDGDPIQTLPTGPNPAPPEERSPPTQFYVTTTEAGLSSLQDFSFNLRPPPKDFFEIVPAEEDLELFEVRERVREKVHNDDTIGTWTVRLGLVRAGDCPDAASPLDSQFDRANQCRIQNAATQGRDPNTPPEEDTGNPIILSKFNYFWSDFSIEEQ